MIDTIAFFKNIGPSLQAMSDEDAGIVIKALFAHNAGQDTNISRASEMVKAIYPLLEESTDRLNAIREAKSKAGKTKATNEEQKGNRTESNEEQKGNEEGTHNHNHSHNQNHNHSQNHDHTSPDGEEERERELKLPKEIPLPPGLDQDFVQEAFRNFREMRRKIRKPLTQKAEELIIKDLMKLSKGDAEKAERILLQSVKNSWQGVFQLKGEEKPVYVPKDDRKISYADFARESFLKEVIG